MLRSGVNRLSSVLVRYQRERQDAKLSKTKAKEPIRLLRVHEVPEIYRQSGILTGYVPNGSPLRTCIGSLLMASNEAFNFWSHLAAALYFIWSLVQFSGSEDLHQQSTWPFVSYMLSVCLYPLASCAAHSLSALSQRTAHLFFFVDYAAVSMFGFGAALLYRGYCLPTTLHYTVYGRLFLPGALLVSTLSTLCACASRFLGRDAVQKRLRVVSFAAPYLWTNAPVLVRTLLEPGRRSAPMHQLQTLLSALAGACYGCRWPERLAPGRFDVAGHSHNLLHVLGTLATYQQMMAARTDMAEARHQNPDHVAYMAYWATTGALIAVAINASIVAVAVGRTWRRLDNQRHSVRKELS